MSSESIPISLKDFSSALSGLNHDNLDRLKDQIINSLNMLIETNNYLSEEKEKTTQKLAENITEEAQNTLEEDLELYRETIKENETVIARQKDRIAAINDELVARGFVTEESIIKEQIELFKKLDLKDKSSAINNPETEPFDDDHDNVNSSDSSEGPDTVYL
ncbi:uncharacterized protein RJT20DRAFT_54180 [Scheffersomyces xylosifermentans]|uniref:uncharacterized protein n=1 Tax=Scheffersomyces xylosifermentans TaxID=1304137 RepID=UPI00315DBC62